MSLFPFSRSVRPSRKACDIAVTPDTANLPSEMIAEDRQMRLCPSLDFGIRTMTFQHQRVAHLYHLSDAEAIWAPLQVDKQQAFL